MAMDVVLLDEVGQQVRGLSDPSGGTFDAAGDFDRLLTPGGSSPVWSLIDPDDEVRLDHPQARALIDELPALLSLSKPGPERRGLERLRALAERATCDPTLILVFRGD